MKISVAICTRNRAQSLARTLESLTALRPLSDASWELLIIDNGSHDETPEVVQRFSDRLPIRRVFESEGGLSRARNRAIDEATGEYIVWTDDDVLVDPDWLVAYAEAFRAYPDAAVFGGKILPRFDQPTPKWFSLAVPLLGALLAHRDFGDASIALQSPGTIPYGANYGIRMREQRGFKYDPELGASPYHRRLGEETTVIASILDSGRKGVWIPRSIVYHCISTERQTIAHVIDYYRSVGATAAFAESPYRCRLWLGVPRWLWLRLLRRFLRYHYDRLSKPPETWVLSLMKYGHDIGRFDHWWRLAKKPALNMPSQMRIPVGTRADRGREDDRS